MTSKIGVNVPNPFLNPMVLWPSYLRYWIEVSRNFYENAIRINEQWLKAHTFGILFLHSKSRISSEPLELSQDYVFKRFAILF